MTAAFRATHVRLSAAHPRHKGRSCAWKQLKVGSGPWTTKIKLVEGILDQAADAVIFADRSGKIARWNRASTLPFGFSAAAALD